MGFQRSVKGAREENGLRTAGFYVPVPLSSCFCFLLFFASRLERPGTISQMCHHCLHAVTFVPTF